MSGHFLVRCRVCQKRIRVCLLIQRSSYRLLKHCPWTGKQRLLTAEQRLRFEKKIGNLLAGDVDLGGNFWEVVEMKKRARAEQRQKGEFTTHAEPFFGKLPEINRVLWDCWYDDGSPRELGKLTIGLVPAGVNLALTDPSERMSAFCTADTLKDALKLLEDALAGSGDPWRPWPASFGKKKA